MNTRTTSRLVWGLSALVAVIFATGFLFPSTADSVLFSLVAVPFLIVGALVARRRPDNPVGWLFLGFAGVAAVAFTGMAYWASGPSGAGSRPGASVAASLAIHLWHPGFSLFILAFLLFPDGRLMSPRWRTAAGVTVALGIVGVLSGMLEHAFYRDFLPDEPVLPAPLVTGPVADVAAWIFSFCVLALVFGVLVLSSVCIFLRFRRSTGVVRQQMKWVMSAIALFAIALPGSLIFLGEARGVLTLPLIPISAGIAILRYRLFDIDLIINRALVYGALTAALALVYVGGVLSLSAIVGSVTGQESSTLAVAASTLVVAGLFGPFRRWVQAFIDRRFYRHKYDAEQSVGEFTARLRDQLDLDSLNAELTAVVSKTVQPTQVSVWLKAPR
jgi:hypothetical protein